VLSVLEANDLLEEAEALSARQSFAELDALLREAPETELESSPQLLHLLANANWRLGHINLALEMVKRAAWQFGALGNSPLYRRHRILRGVLMLEAGDLGAAEEYFAEVTWLAHDVGDSFGLGVATMNQGVAADVRCEWDAALTSYQRAIAAFERNGNLSWVPRCQHNMAMTYRQIGQPAKSHSYFDQALAGLAAYGTPGEILCSRAERALLLEMNGDHAFAIKIADTALRQAEIIEDIRCVGELLRVNGILLRAEARVKEARRFLVRSWRVAHRHGAKLLEAESLEELSICYAEIGDYERARVVMARAARVFEAMGATMRARMGWTRLDTFAFDLDH
jgi:tetratricopeptide (TPR) repeat protein